MHISFIGAGKVGTSLGKYFQTKGIPVVGYYSKTLKSAQEAAQFTNSNYYSNLQQMISDSDVIFFTVPDDDIQTVWEENRKFISNKIIIHCSGLGSSKIFSEAEAYNCMAYSVHPLCAVGSKEHSYKHLSETMFTIEGDEKYISNINSFFTGLGNPTKIISWKDKTKYHAAASLASNHMTAIFYVAKQMLTQCGFDEAEAEHELFKLAEGNLVNIGKMGAVNSLTGPIERGDVETVRKHLQVLKDDERSIYEDLAGKLIEISEIKHPDKSYEEMKEIFKK